MVTADPGRRTARDEQEVLDELARLQRELEETRRRRRQAADAFNTFLSTFPRRGSASKEATDTRGSREPSFTGTRSSRLPSQGTGRQQPGRVTQAAASDRVSRRARMGILAAAVVVSVAALVLLVRPWGGSEPSQPAVTRSLTDAPAVALPLPAETRAPAPPPAELLTIRQVWMRVVVDGARVVEREVPAGTRIALTGAEVVVRSGDAGAVRFLRRGEDQGALGADGAVVTRTFLVVPE